MFSFLNKKTKSTIYENIDYKGKLVDLFFLYENTLYRFTDRCELVRVLNHEGGSVTAGKKCIYSSNAQTKKKYICQKVGEGGTLTETIASKMSSSAIDIEKTIGKWRDLDLEVYISKNELLRIFNTYLFSEIYIAEVLLGNNDAELFGIVTNSISYITQYKDTNSLQNFGSGKGGIRETNVDAVTVIYESLNVNKSKLIYTNLDIDELKKNIDTLTSQSNIHIDTSMIYYKLQLKKYSDLLQAIKNNKGFSFPDKYSKLYHAKRLAPLFIVVGLLSFALGAFIYFKDLTEEVKITYYEDKIEKITQENEKLKKKYDENMKYDIMHLYRPLTQEILSKIENDILLKYDYDHYKFIIDANKKTITISGEVKGLESARELTKNENYSELKPEERINIDEDKKEDLFKFKFERKLDFWNEKK